MPSDTTPFRTLLAELIEMEKRATPGPLKLAELKNCTDGFPDSLALIGGEIGIRGPAVCCFAPVATVTLLDEDNAKLFAALRNAAPRILPFLQTAIDEVEAWRAWNDYQGLDGFECDQLWTNVLTARARLDAQIASVGG